MVKVVNQDMPGWLYRQYERSLGFAQKWKEGSDIRTIRKRPPYRLPHMKTNSGNSPSGAQKKVREAFGKCVDCFNKSPKTGGVEPPAMGYRSKEWWYNEAGKETWPDYYGLDFLRWTGDPQEAEQLKDTNYQWHDANWFLKTDEADFTTFYNEMKSKYGYPWSPNNDPDQIATKMNQIVCNEIDYDTEGDMSVCFTPGQTAHNRKGVCDDQSVLHYALTHKALKEIGWTDGEVDYRLSCVFNTAESSEHVYNWWQMNNGVTKIVENTYDPGESPKVIGDMDSWNWTKPEFVYQRFNKSGHWSPKVEANGTIIPLWYYNYFIHMSWQIFYDGDVPDWCGDRIPLDHMKDAYYKSSRQGTGNSFAAAWANGYYWYGLTNWSSCSIELPLRSYGWVWCIAPTIWRAQPFVLKKTLVFKPINHVSEAAWNGYETFSIKFERTPIGTDPKAGGAIKLVQTGEIKEQIFGWLTFNIPKSMTNYNEFDVTLEGLNRNLDDLKPNVPPGAGSRYCGSNDKVDTVELLCT